MEQSNHLFELIKSLSKSEKRYFKVRAGVNNNYVKLFDALESTKIYDERIFKEKYSGEQFIKNLAYNKVYLYNELLRTLSLFHSGKTVESEIRELLSRYEFLLSKGLMLQAKKLIEKAYKIARDEEKHHYLLLITAGKTELKNVIVNQNERVVFMNSIASEQYEMLSMMKNQSDYYILSTSILKFMNITGGIRTAEERNQIKEILDNELMNDASSAISLDAKCYYYFTKHLCYLCLDNTEEAYKNSLMGLGLLRDADLSKSQSRARLRTALGAHLLLLRYFPDNDSEFISCLKRYREAIYPDRNKIQGRFLDSYNSEILFNIKKGFFERNTALIKEIENILNDLKNYESTGEYFFLASNAAYSEFITGHYEKSLEWNNIALKEKERVMSHKAASLVMILSLMLHYELKNYDLLEYQMISIYRNLLKKKRLFAYESLVLGFIKSSTKNISDAELAERFAIVRKKLIEISSEPNEKMAFEDFDLVSWLESKLKGKQFIEILKEKLIKSEN